MTVLPTEALMQRVQSRPASTAFVFQEKLWTYEKLAQESERVARGLAASGVKAGDRVVLHMINRPRCSLPIMRASGWVRSLRRFVPRSSLPS